MKAHFKLPLFILGLLLVVFASGCTDQETGSNIDEIEIETDDSVRNNVEETNETELSIGSIKTKSDVTEEDIEEDVEKNTQKNDDEEENEETEESNEEDEETETTNTQTNTNGDSGVELSSYEGPANTTIKYSASGFEPQETVEIRMSGLYYVAATFYSHDGTIPPSDLYIPPHNSAGEPLEGEIEIIARGAKSGREFVTYYTVTD